MPFAFVISTGRKVPYKDISGWSSVLNDHAAAIEADAGQCRCTDFGNAGFYLGLVNASAATLNAIDADPNCEVLPQALNFDLGGMTNAQKTRLRNVLNAAGYSGAELDAAFGTDFSGITLRQALKFVMSRNQLATYNKALDKFTWDGPINQLLPVPGLDILGGSPIRDVPPGVLDNFDRADSTSLGGIWSATLRDSSPSCQILSNVLAGPPSVIEGNNYVTGFSCDDVDIGLTMSTIPTLADVSVLARCTVGTPFTGYQFFSHNNANVQMWRGVSSAYTQIGVSTTFVGVSGDQIRFRLLGSSLTGYTGHLGVWTSRIAQTDANITQKGVIGLEWSSNGSIPDAGRANDFFGDGIPNWQPIDNLAASRQAVMQAGSL